MYNLEPEMVSSPSALPFWFGESSESDRIVRQVVEVLDLAQHYKIAGLANAASAVIAEQMSVSNVCAVLSAATRFNRPELVTRCTEFTERHLAALLNTAAFCELPDSAVMSLVQSDKSQAEELDIFNGLVRWGRKRFGSGAPSSPAAAAPANPGATAANAAAVKANLAAYLGHIRFPLIDGKSLDSVVEASGLVDEALLLEAYRFHSSGRLIQSSPRFRRRGGGVALPRGMGSQQTGAQQTPAHSTQRGSMASSKASPQRGSPTGVKPTPKPTHGPAPAPTPVKPQTSNTAANPGVAAAATPHAPNTPKTRGPHPPSSPAPKTPAAPTASPSPGNGGVPTLTPQLNALKMQWLKMCDFIPPAELVTVSHRPQAPGMHNALTEALCRGRTSCSHT